MFDHRIEIVEPLKKYEEDSELFHDVLENLKLLQSITFPEFIQITSFLLESGTADAHFIPPSRIMTNGDSVLVDCFFKMESIQEDWKKICDLLNKKMIIGANVNRTNYEGPDKYFRFYNTKMREIVVDKYRIDFVNFDYSVNCD